MMRAVVHHARAVRTGRRAMTVRMAVALFVPVVTVLPAMLPVLRTVAIAFTAVLLALTTLALTILRHAILAVVPAVTLPLLGLTVATVLPLMPRPFTSRPFSLSLSLSFIFIFIFIFVFILVLVLVLVFILIAVSVGEQRSQPRPRLHDGLEDAPIGRGHGPGGTKEQEHDEQGRQPAGRGDRQKHSTHHENS
jgi:hypothetical protein